MDRRRFAFVQVDVFTRTPLEGNALAVFPDARGLSDDELQAIARETNLSETTFVFPEPGAAPGLPVRVRVFTVEEELPFAGHPTLGTAAVLRGGSGAGEVVVALPVGRIPVAFEDRVDGTFGEMRQRDPVFGAVVPHAEAAAALGLAVGALDASLPVQTVSTGVPFTLVPLRGLADMLSLPRELRHGGADLMAVSGGKFPYFGCRETVDAAARLHARMMFHGVEDPATGSAAGCCVAWSVRHGVAAVDERVVIEQGLEMKRPSRIFVRAGGSREAIADVRVGGYVVEVARGELSV